MNPFPVLPSELAGRPLLYDALGSLTATRLTSAGLGVGSLPAEAELSRAEDCCLVGCALVGVGTRSFVVGEAASGNTCCRCGAGCLCGEAGWRD